MINKSLLWHSLLHTRAASDLTFITVLDFFIRRAETHQAAMLTFVQANAIGNISLTQETPMALSAHITALRAIDSHTGGEPTRLDRGRVSRSRRGQHGGTAGAFRTTL